MAKPVRMKHPYIEKRAAICGGRPVVRGTRIPVWIVFQRYRAGQSPEEIQAAYPHLSLSQIHEALAYAFDHLDEIKGDLKANSVGYWRKRLKDSTSPST